MSRAHIYTRTSTGEQQLGHEAQEAECRALAARLALPVTSVTHEHASGSTPATSRPEFQRLLHSLSPGDKIIMWRRDRLGRVGLDNALTEKMINARGASIITGEVTPEDTPESGVMRAMLDAMAEYELALIRRRTKAALAAKKARGERVGMLPLGFTANSEGYLIPDPEEAGKLALVRAWRADGLTLEEIEQKCKAENITARKGAAPSRASLARWCAPPTPRPRGRPCTTSAELESACIALHAQGLPLRQIANALSAQGFRNTLGKPLSHGLVNRIIKRRGGEG